jgi:GT2 family glycosyltransferase
MSDVTIAVPAFNDDPAVFARALGLMLAGSGDERVLVVDMSTDERLGPVCEEAGPRVTRSPFPQSGGVSHSRNRCVELADTRYVAFVDSDAYVRPGWLGPLRACLEQERVAVVGSRIVAHWESDPPPLLRTRPAGDWLSLFDLGDQPLDVPRIIGTSYALDRTRVPDPPFDESIGRKPGWALAGEENVLCEAARAAGGRVVYVPDSVVEHRIPPDRATWRWMWSRAHAAGRETRLFGRFEPLPARRLDARDRAFQAAVAGPFFAGRLRPRPRRPG